MVVVLETTTTNNAQRMDCHTYGGRYFFVAILMNMSNNENERGAHSVNEQPRQPNGCVSEAASLLQSLGNSPILDEGYWLTTLNLCQAIITIADTVGELVDDFIVCVEKKREMRVESLELTKERIWQIRSLAEVIDERIRNEDYEKIMLLKQYACL